MCDGPQHSYSCLSDDEMKDLIYQRATWMLYDAQKKGIYGHNALGLVVKKLQKEFGSEYDFELIMKDSEEYEAVKKKRKNE